MALSGCSTGDFRSAWRTRGTDRRAGSGQKPLSSSCRKPFRCWYSHSPALACSSIRMAANAAADVLTYLLAVSSCSVSVVALGSLLLPQASADPVRGLDDRGQRLIRWAGRGKFLGSASVALHRIFPVRLGHRKPHALLAFSVEVARLAASAWAGHAGHRRRDRLAAPGQGRGRRPAMAADALSGRALAAWVAGLTGLLWLGLYALLLPAAVRGVGDIAQALPAGRSSDGALASC